MNSTNVAKEPAEIAASYINNTNRHIFLTGKAGTGKTTFLLETAKNCHKKTIVAAPTGIAAINAGGVTLHSLFHLPFGAYVPDNNWVASDRIRFKVTTPQALISGMQMNEKRRSLLREMELLIIDEVSMLRADLLDAIDDILRHVRRRPKHSFGGVQILFIGDMLQLPPVVKPEESELLARFYTSNYFFDAHSLRTDKPVYIELEKIFRQSDPLFLKLLNNLRNDEMDDDDVALLNTRVIEDFSSETGDGYIHLVTHNHKADSINEHALNSLPEKSWHFAADVEGDFPEHLYPIERIMLLKKGAQVMFIKNDSNADRKYFNGKIGVVTELDENSVKVEFENEKIPVTVDKYTWENKRYTLNEYTNQIEEEIIGRFVHYPLKLAWAITIHKSQGLTFDKAIVDISGAFAPGQVYVALSRLRSLQGLVLTHQLKRKNLLKDSLLQLFTKQKTSHTALTENLKTDSVTYLHRILMEAFDLTPLHKLLKELAESYTKDILRSEKQKFYKTGTAWFQTISEAKTIADRFLVQLQRMFQEVLEQDPEFKNIAERVTAAKNYFDPLFSTLLTEIKEHSAEVKNIKKAKGYQTELQEIDNLSFKTWLQVRKSEALTIALFNEGFLSKESVSDLNALIQKNLEQSGRLPESKQKSEQKQKLPKGYTYTVSLDMFRKGMSMAEIAETRKMTVSTIEGHLSKFIGTGEINVFELLNVDKYNKICDAAENSEKPVFKDLLMKLGEGFSYGEIRMALSHREHLKEKALEGNRDML